MEHGSAKPDAVCKQAENQGWTACDIELGNNPPPLSISLCATPQAILCATPRIYDYVSLASCIQHSPCLTADELEYVCVRCGEVLASAEPAHALVTSKLNLYTGYHLGGQDSLVQLPLADKRSLKVASRQDSGASRYLSAFSNACESLGLSESNASCAWRVFCKVYNELSSGKPRRIGAAEAAFYSICHCHETADEYEVSKAVSSAFGSKKLRDLYHLRILVSTHTELPQLQIRGSPLTTSSNWVRGMMNRRISTLPKPPKGVIAYDKFKRKQQQGRK